MGTSTWSLWAFPLASGDKRPAKRPKAPTTFEQDRTTFPVAASLAMAALRAGPRFRLALGPMRVGIAKGSVSPSTTMVLISTAIPTQQARLAAALWLLTVLQPTKPMSKSAKRGSAYGPREPDTSISTAFRSSGK